MFACCLVISRIDFNRCTPHPTPFLYFHNCASTFSSSSSSIKRLDGCVFSFVVFFRWYWTGLGTFCFFPLVSVWCPSDRSLSYHYQNLESLPCPGRFWLSCPFMSLLLCTLWSMLGINFCAKLIRFCLSVTICTTETHLGVLGNVWLSVSATLVQKILLTASIFVLPVLGSVLHANLRMENFAHAQLPVLSSLPVH